MKRLDEVSIEEMERNCRLQILKADLTTVAKQGKRQEVILKYRNFEKRMKNRKLHDYMSRFLDEDKRNLDNERDMVTQFLIENEEDIDKGKVLLLTFKKYLESKEALNNRNHPLHDTYIKEKKALEQALERTEVMAEDILKDQDIVISRTLQYPWEKYYFVQVLMSKELVNHISIPGERKRERESKKVIHALPDKALLTAVLMANESIADKDIYMIPSLGRDIANATLENAEIEGILTYETKEKFKNSPK